MQLKVMIWEFQFVIQAIKLSEEFNENINKVEKINIYTHEPAVR